MIFPSPCLLYLSRAPSISLTLSPSLVKTGRFDANGDGKISVTELDNVLCSLGSPVPTSELQRIMEDLDNDHDGFINLSEFAAFCKSESSSSGGASELRRSRNEGRSHKPTTATLSLPICEIPKPRSPN
ncbi:hypothetical protein RIF29_20357 [Crotalaria pallida]|uniref:EF-hand domain-containing protein n=1 Tax=Crotalaria pallida TaxID=3830 RepID=A0AAN9F2T1_CROPI